MFVHRGVSHLDLKLSTVCLVWQEGLEAIRPLSADRLDDINCHLCTWVPPLVGIEDFWLPDGRFRVQR